MLPWVILGGKRRGFPGSPVQSPPMSRSKDNCSMARRLPLDVWLPSRWTLNAFGLGRREWADGLAFFSSHFFSFCLYLYRGHKANRVTQSSVLNGSLPNTAALQFTDGATFNRRGLG